jgi:hypothetical protein
MAPEEEVGFLFVATSPLDGPVNGDIGARAVEVRLSRAQARKGDAHSFDT